jgi:hypothetical protein
MGSEERGKKEREEGGILLWRRSRGRVLCKSSFKIG